MLGRLISIQCHKPPMSTENTREFSRRCSQITEEQRAQGLREGCGVCLVEVHTAKIYKLNAAGVGA